LLKALETIQDDNRIDIPQGAATRVNHGSAKAQSKASSSGPKHDDTPGPNIPLDDESSSQLQAFLRGLLRKYGVLNLPYLHQQTRREQDKGNFAALGVNVSDDLVRQETLKIGCQVQDVYCVKLLGDDMLDQVHIPNSPFPSPTLTPL